MAIKDNFWESCDRGAGENECWPWRRAISNRGYGQLRVRGRTTSAHRFSYELVNGEIPAGLVVMHSCDNRCCVNPAHLSLGTITDNNTDAVVKGRSSIGFGEKNINAKLAVNDIKQIKFWLARGTKIKTLAKTFGCSQYAIRDIKNGRSWSWAP